MRNDWKRRFIANPLVNQKIILRILAMSRIAQTSIENDPTDEFALINRYCDK